MAETPKFDLRTTKIENRAIVVQGDQIAVQYITPECKDGFCPIVPTQEIQKRIDRGELGFLQTKTGGAIFSHPQTFDDSPHSSERMPIERN